MTELYYLKKLHPTCALIITINSLLNRNVWRDKTSEQLIIIIINEFTSPRYHTEYRHVPLCTGLSEKLQNTACIEWRMEIHYYICKLQLNTTTLLTRIYCERSDRRMTLLICYTIFPCGLFN